MKDILRIAAVACALVALFCMAGTAAAQRRGGVLQMHLFDRPVSMSILEEWTRAAEQPMMAAMRCVA